MPRRHYVLEHPAESEMKKRFQPFHPNGAFFDILRRIQRNFINGRVGGGHAQISNLVAFFDRRLQRPFIDN